MTLRNRLRFDAEKSSIYKRAAQTFDLFLAPKMKDILDQVPDDARIDFYNFPVVSALPFASNGKERSEALEYLCPKHQARKFANSEINNQELIDKSQVVVNGVRIALDPAAGGATAKRLVASRVCGQREKEALSG